ncbi:MAG: glycosyltransferase family 2 protein [Prevotellaceae bacterium]|nr:glycosyltransferase family 2 protein [Candidatus Minthosoma equi]
MEANNANQPIVTVIVPVYRSEAYFERCCKNLFGQTLQSIEYLFIIDGPSPKTESIIASQLLAFPNRKEQVRIIFHDSNFGTSYSRQEGHEQAKGEYLYHCDSDDWLEPTALEELYNIACQDNSDLVFADYVRHYETSGQNVTYSSSYVLRGEINTIDGTLCNKLIRRELITAYQLKFPSNINWGEDLCMSVLLQVVAKKISYIPKTIYHYCLHSNSLTTSVELVKYLQLVSCPIYIDNELKRLGRSEQYQKLILRLKFESKEYFLIHPKLRNVSKWLSIYPECHPYIWKFTSVPFYLKLVSWLAVNNIGFLANLLLLCREKIHQLRGVYR